MIKFEIDNSKEGVEILLDSLGVDELINYLHFIKNNQESIHLIAGNELNEEMSQNEKEIIRHVKLVYLE
ncbi:MAG: hypothetical protein R3D00_00525 [Bacteroidia bacterium]